MLDTHRNWFKGLEVKTAKVFAVFPITPNQYTALSIVSILVCGYFLVAVNYWVALGFFALASILDFIDGAVARLKNLSSKRGAYWDTVADRYVEAGLLFGFLFVGLPEFYLPANVWIFLALFGSMMTTYAKAAAKEKGLSDTELKGGLMSRAERLVIYAAVIISLNYCLEAAVFMLAALAVLTNVTAMQRIARALSA
jgi:archaetidylinositol phosphate synthase